MKQTKNTLIKSEEGSGLVLAIMILLVLSALGSALGVVTIGSYKLADINLDRTSAYYIAEAGANMAYEEIENYVLNAYNESVSPGTFFDEMTTPLFNLSLEQNNLSTKEYSQFNYQNGTQPKSKVTIKEKHREDSVEVPYAEYVIESIGTVNGKERNVEKKFVLNWKKKSTSDSPITLPNNDAAITLNGTVDASLVQHVDGTIYLTEVAKNNEENEKFKPNGNNKNVTLSNEKWSEISTIKFAIPERPIVKSEHEIANIKLNNETLTLNLLQNTYIKKLTFEGDSTLNVNTNGKSLMLVVDELQLNKPKINVLSGGNLTIYYTGEEVLQINNEFNYNGSLIAPNSDINSTANPFVLNGDLISGGYISVWNGPVINGNIYANNDIIMQKAKVNGLIISKENITFENTSTLNALVFAPYGEVQMQDSSNLTGSLVAKDINFRNNNTIKYSNDYLKYLPKGENSEDDIILSDIISSFPTIEQ